MTLHRAKKLQAALRKVPGTCTLLVVPGLIKEYPWAGKEYNAVTGPYVIAGQLEPDRFYEPEKNAEGGWAGVFSIVVDGKEIPVQWISDYIAGTAFTLINPEGYPCAIFATYEEANKKYVELWPPQDVHRMDTWPQILNPKGERTQAAFRGAGLNYPWRA